MAAGAEAFFASVASSSLSFMAQQLSPLTRYSWFVRAELGGLDSPNSNEVVLSTPDLLPAPTNVVTTVQPPEGVAVSWAAVIGATEYQVLQSSSGGAFARALSVDATATSAVVANLVSGVAYRFEVAAVDATHTLGHVSVPSSVNLP
jgi:fibronectin type 3 domain-containing protein